MQQCLGALRVDAQAEDLRETAAAADYFVQPVRGAPGDVAGVQVLGGAAPCEVRGVFGVAEHDVRARVDQLTGVPARPVGVGLQVEGAAGYGDADRFGAGRGEVRGQVGHARCRLGLAVHHVQVPAVAPPQLRVADDPFGGESAACLGDAAQVGQAQLGEADPVEQVEGVGDRREGGAACGAQEVPEAVLRDGEVGEDQAGASQQVAVDDGQAVAVVHGQGGGGAVVFADVQVRGDGLGVGLEVLVRQAYEFG